MASKVNISKDPLGNSSNTLYLKCCLLLKVSRETLANTDIGTSASQYRTENGTELPYCPARWSRLCNRADFPKLSRETLAITDTSVPRARMSSAMGPPCATVPTHTEPSCVAHQMLLPSDDEELILDH